MVKRSDSRKREGSDSIFSTKYALTYTTPPDVSPNRRSSSPNFLEITNGTIGGRSRTNLYTRNDRSGNIMIEGPL